MGTARSGRTLQAKVLAKLAALPHWVFGAVMPFDGGLYGDAILSRFPIRSWRSFLLPTIPGAKEPRGFLLCTVDTGGKCLTAASTHWGLDPAERMLAAHWVRRTFADQMQRLLIGGDLNAGVRVTGRRQYAFDLPRTEIEQLSTVLKSAAAVCDCDPLLTFPADSPAGALDYLFTSPDLAVEWIRRIPTHVSDHLPLLAQVALP